MIKTIYEDTANHWDAYNMCEKLIDLEVNFQLWRFRHMKTVERIIGYKPGTGGSSGVAFLRKALDIKLFPELYSVRTELERADGAFSAAAQRADLPRPVQQAAAGRLPARCFDPRCSGHRAAVLRRPWPSARSARARSAPGADKLQHRAPPVIACTARDPRNRRHAAGSLPG